MLTIYSENALTLIACMSPNIFSYKTNFKETKVIFMQQKQGSFNNSVFELKKDLFDLMIFNADYWIIFLHLNDRIRVHQKIFPNISGTVENQI